MKRKETFEILLKNGFMIPNGEQLNAIGVVAEGNIQKNFPLIFDLLLIDIFFILKEFLEQESLEIPKSFFNIWLEFLMHCNENNLITLFLESLIVAYKTEIENLQCFNLENLRTKFILSWIVCLIRNNSYKNGI